MLLPASIPIVEKLSASHAVLMVISDQIITDFSCSSRHLFWYFTSVFAFDVIKPIHYWIEPVHELLIEFLLCELLKSGCFCKVFFGWFFPDILEGLIWLFVLSRTSFNASIDSFVPWLQYIQKILLMYLLLFLEFNKLFDSFFKFWFVWIFQNFGELFVFHLLRHFLFSLK